MLSDIAFSLFILFLLPNINTAETKIKGRIIHVGNSGIVGDELGDNVGDGV